MKARPKQYHTFSKVKLYTGSRKGRTNFDSTMQHNHGWIRDLSIKGIINKVLYLGEISKWKKEI
jgi:hypothetical protein